MPDTKGILFEELSQLVNMTEAEFELFATFLEPRQLNKKEYLFINGEICRWVGFVNKGCLRYYLIDQKGEEHIVYFAVERWWVADLNSFFKQTPTIYNLQALEPTELYLLSLENFQKACAAVPKYEAFYRIKTQRAYSATTERFMDAKSLSAEEKYLKLLATYPDIFRRVPQHYIAAYLGIKPQSLSRIRKKLASKG